LNVDHDIRIAATIGSLPPKLITEDQYGLFLQGWHAIDGLRDDPDDECENVLTVVLKVDRNLNPRWFVEKQSTGESKEISFYNRIALGMVRIGTEINKHFAWGRGSALARISENKSDVRATIIQTLRGAKSRLDLTGIPELAIVSKFAQETGVEFGQLPAEAYRASLDAGYSLESGAIALHEGNVPLRMLGFGSRKLLALSLQWVSIEEGAILLVDEIEHGLEPHRIRQLLRTLKPKANNGQIIFTSHSPSSILESNSNNIFIVRNTKGTCTIYQCGEELLPVIRSCATALLARRIIVCEGKTEQGICKGLNTFWEQEKGYGLSHLGVEVIDGGGTEHATIKALKLKEMGYDVALFVDHDKNIKDEVVLLQQGIVIFRWDAKNNTEDQLCHDLEWSDLKKFVLLGQDKYGDTGDQFNSITSFLEAKLEGSYTDIDEFRANGIQDDKVRTAIAKCASKKAWFKDVDPASELAEIIIGYLNPKSKSTIAKVLLSLKDWIYGNHTKAPSGKQESLCDSASGLR
jgi:hypothetical protein